MITSWKWRVCAVLSLSLICSVPQRGTNVMPEWFTPMIQTLTHWLRVTLDHGQKNSFSETLNLGQEQKELNQTLIYWTSEEGMLTERFRFLYWLLTMKRIMVLTQSLIQWLREEWSSVLTEKIHWIKHWLAEREGISHNGRIPRLRHWLGEQGRNESSPLRKGFTDPETDSLNEKRSICPDEKGTMIY